MAHSILGISLRNLYIHTVTHYSPCIPSWLIIYITVTHSIWGISLWLILHYRYPYCESLCIMYIIMTHYISLWLIPYWSYHRDSFCITYIYTVKHCVPWPTKYHCNSFHIEIIHCDSFWIMYIMYIHTVTLHVVTHCAIVITTTHSVLSISQWLWIRHIQCDWFCIITVTHSKLHMTHSAICIST